MNKIFVFSLVLNLLYVVVEATMGFYENSLSLLSDAGHNLSDTFSLLLVLVAFRLAKVHSNRHYTYGLKKSSILISLLNAIVLLVAVGAIIVESIHKFTHPVEINGMVVTWTAVAGIVVNGLTALLLMRGQQGDINVRGAYLHMLTDTLVSVGVVISGIVITYTGWCIIDPIVSCAIAIVILVWTWKLLSESLRLCLDGAPSDINYDQVERAMKCVEGVDDVHHIHIWALSTQENALTAHITLSSITALNEVKSNIKVALKAVNITHSTLEFETAESPCSEHCCEQCQHRKPEEA